jgi:hypothetical protein
MLVSGDMELVASPPVEGAPLVRADLRRDPEAAQQCEGASCDRRIGDVQMNRHLPSASEVHAAGRVEETGKLREPVALAPRRDRRELVAEILRE